jgi:hypothetical protein
MRGMRVNDNLIPILDISLGALKTLTLGPQFKIPKSRAIDKKSLCNKLVEYRGEQEKKSAGAPTTSAADAIATPPFNDYRYLNNVLWRLHHQICNSCMVTTKAQFRPRISRRPTTLHQPP